MRFAAFSSTGPRLTLANVIDVGLPPGTRVLVGLLPIALAAVLFAVTFPVSQGLPVLGDGAYHAIVIEEIAVTRDVRTPTVTHYPPLYHILGAQLYLFLGTSGTQLISPLAIAFASLLMYLIVIELTGRPLLGLMTQGLLTSSPLLIQYSTVILMEPLLVAMILFGTYVLLVANRNKTRRVLVLVALALASGALVKQVGIVAPVAGVLFLVLTGAGWRRVAALTLLVLAITAGPYLFLYSRSDALIGTALRPPTVLKERSQSVVGSVLHGDAWSRTPAWSWELENELDTSRIYDRGTLAHRQGYVRPSSLIHWDQFAFLHSLYPESFFYYASDSRPWLQHILNVLLISGFLLAIVKAVRSPPWRMVVLLLLVSYPALSLGNDTKRYFLHVAVISAVFPVLTLWIVHRLIGKWRNPGRSASIRSIARLSLADGIVAALVILTILEIYPLARDQVQVMENHRFAQGGGFLSRGGMDSLRMASDWLNANSEPSDTYMAASPHEWTYYSQRRDLWREGLDYRLYFLPEDRIDYYMRQAEVRYVIIRQNQLVADRDWNHIERVPRSFHAKVRRIYPEAYVTPSADIRIYEVPETEPS